MAFLNTKKHSIYAVFFGLCLVTLTSVSQSQTSQIQGPRDNTQVYSGVVYGPIDNNDTLWGIASRYKQGSQFSVYQTMYAIYELNPQAFENGNFNKMVSGATLQLPSDPYIARVDVNVARAKALEDEQSVGSTKPSQAQPTTNNTPQSPVVTPSNVASQSDLSNTQQQLQTQLNAVRLQQQEQFGQLKDQVSDSIKSVEILIEENKKLTEQLQIIDENNRLLTESVETQLQGQIDEQMAQLSEIIELVKSAEKQRIDAQSSSVLNYLASPIAIIIIMGVVTLSLLVGLTIFLLRRTAPAPAPVAEDSPVSPQTATKDIVDDDLVIGEVDSAIDNDSDDLLAELADDGNEDDILSDELASEEALDDLDDDLLNDELDSLDDMLVPDVPSNDKPSTESDISELTDVDNLALDDSNLDIDDLVDENPPEVATPADDVEIDLTSDSDDPDSDIPRGIELDDKGEIDDKTLSQIEEQIEQKDEKINDLADDILNQLDSGVSDELESDLSLDSELDLDADFDLDGNESNTDKNQGSDDDVLKTQTNSENIDTDGDTQSDDIDLTNELDEVEANTFEQQEANEIDLTSETVSDELDETDSLANELLDELTEQDSQSEELDSLLGELSIDDELDTEHVAQESSEVADAVSDDEIETLLEQDDDNSLASELLDELSQDSDELDALLDEDTIESVNTTGNDNVDEDAFLSDIPSFTSDLSLAEEKDSAIEKPQETPESKETRVTDQEALPQEAEQQSDNGSADNDEPIELKQEVEAEEDVLSTLPDLDNWVDEETQTSNDKDSEVTDFDELDLSALELDIDDLTISDTDFTSEISSEDDILNELDNNDFDDMLSELSSEGTSENDVEKEFANTPRSKSNPLEEAGLDLDELTTKPELADDGFVDVDDLLKESESGKALTDDELDLDLERSLGNLSFNASESSSNDDSNFIDTDLENDQSGNLDLAQVYLDMEDTEAARELLEQVVKEGNSEERKEAKALLALIKL